MLSTPEFWVAVAFVIFVALIVWKVTGPMLKALDARADRIRAELDEAQKLREEAQHLLAEYKRKQRDAEKEAAEMLDHAEAEAKRMRAHAEEELQASLKRREQQALDRIAQAEAQAVTEVRNLAVDLAVAATRKLLEERLDQAKADALVKEATDALPEKLRH